MCLGDTIMPEELKINEYIKNVFRDRVKENISYGSHKPDGKFHVSSIVYGCPRKLYFEYKYGPKTVINNDDEMFRIWVGMMLHETKITDFHEFNIEKKYDDFIISGAIDEILEKGDKRYIIDKKFVLAPPNEMYDHHRKQVMYYAYLLRETKGITVNGIALLYFRTGSVYITQSGHKMNGVSIDNIGSSDHVFVFAEEITNDDITRYGKEMESVVSLAIKGIKENRVPDKKESWYCDYCAFKEICKYGDAFGSNIF